MVVVVGLFSSDDFSSVCCVLVVVFGVDDLRYAEVLSMFVFVVIDVLPLFFETTRKFESGQISPLVCGFIGVR